MLRSRRFTLWIHFVLDQLLPPALRDAPWFMGPVFRLLFGRHAETLATFKERVPFLSDDEIRDIYVQTAEVAIDRPTDLNPECTDAIEAHVTGPRVLDAGCGRGWLAKRLAPRFEVVGVDFVISDALREDPTVEWVEAPVGDLPFPDDHFDTVVCTHTLEHVRDLAPVVAELRRVAKERLIIVVPRQRRYRYTFDLHLHFFPTRGALLLAIGPPDEATIDCRDLGGDWYYQEAVSAPAHGAPAP